jgi:hypothetical protein
MPTAATIGHGSSFALGDGAQPEVFTTIAEVYDITPPSETSDVIDATHMSSPGNMREFIMGLTDPGEASFEMNFIPGSASETAILAWRAGRVSKNCRITFPNGWRWTFLALCTGYEPALPADDKMTATVTAKVTGTVTRVAGS